MRAALAAAARERRRLEAELAAKVRLQHLLADLSARFVALPSGQIDAVIGEAQRLIVETLGLDRSTLWQLVPHGSGMVLTHCWQRPGWPPLPPDFPTDDWLPWLYGKVLAGETVRFASVGDLPPAAARDVEMFRRHGPKSSVTFPLVANGRVFGALAFATLGAERGWHDDEVADLRLVAQIIGNVVGRQRAELREEQLRAELAHALRVATLGELVAALAHELNQPLAAILSNAQAARRFVAADGIEPGELRAILDDVVRDVKRAGAVIHNLRGMIGKRAVEREACCLNELVREVMELMHGEFVGEKVEVRLDLAPSLPRLAVARVELQQVLVNLLVNAVQAVKGGPPPDRYIEVVTGVAADAVTAGVRDRGPGIPAERLENIFEPFVSSKSDGLGMGLAICRRIIEDHGGRIAAANHAAGGALFTVALPIPDRDAGRT